MKKTIQLFYLIICLLSFSVVSLAQGGATCANSAPFCTGSTYTFDNNVNTPSQAGPNYGCLLSQPNQSWYYLQVATNGNIDITIRQTTGINNTGSGIDVDFICWGPFTSATGSCGNLTGSNDVDCSYSTAAVEICNIPNAVAGQYYTLLLTNYSNQPGYITFSQTGGAGATNCNVVANCTATINNPGPFCEGNSITMSTSGQANATNYSWVGPNGFSQSGAALTSISIPNATPAMAGTYTLTITRSPGTPCVLTTNVVVNSVSAAFTSPGAQCLTGNSFNFSHTGTAGATHTWNFGGATVNTSTSATPTGITYPAAGTYIVTHVATANGCSRTQTASITVNPMPSLTGTPSNASCGVSNGSIVINNTSPAGQGPFTFTNNGAPVGSPTITGLAAGTYVIAISNTYGCPASTSVVVGNNAGPTNITLTPTNATCGLSNGSFTFGSPVGGTAGYTYSFNGGAFTAVSPITGVAAGTYSITVRDVNGCTFTKTVVVGNNPGPTAITGNTTPTDCGLTNGTYNVTGVTGGTAAYSFSVDGVSTASLTTGLASGGHTILVKDGSGCTYSTTFNIGGAAGPTSAVINTSNATCGNANGTATVSGVGGTLPYQYSFDGGPFLTSTTAAGLTAGQHTVTVKDGGGCTLPVIFNVLNTGSPTASVTNAINVGCFGGTNGSFTTTAAGGTGSTYSYTLTSPYQTNNNGQFSGLPAGSYNITVKDVAGCITTTSVTLTQPTVLTLTPTAIATRCFGTATGTINVVGSGGTPTYSYNLNNGAYQTSATFANQPSSIVTIGIRDANGCTATQTVQVNQPPALAIQVSTQNANCAFANGVATTTVTGGTGAITYAWTGAGGTAAISNSVVAGSYTVTAADANGCTISGVAVIASTPGGTAAITASTNVTCNGAIDGSMTAEIVGGTPNYSYLWTPTGQTSAMATNLAPGTYSCTITDNFGCTSTASGIIVEPPLLSAIMNSQNATCFGSLTGMVSALGTGGVPNYTYNWTSPVVSSLSTITNVGIGNYVCNITDANGCVITQSITVTQPASITLTGSVTSANCNNANGSASITISGGVQPYTQTWSGGASTSTVLSNVTAGTYSINVVDGNACPQDLAVTIPNIAGPTIGITTHNDVSCFGSNDGMAVAVASGGVTPYTYSWSHGSVTSTASNLTAQLYTVSVTDDAGCVASTSVNITQPPALAVSVTPTHPRCFGATNGSGLASVTGGTGAYSYTWTSGGGNDAVSLPIGANDYGLTVMDGNGCIVTTSMTLTNPPAMAASITSTNVNCFAACNGVAIATSTNGVGAVSYYWTGGPAGITTQTASALCAGVYSVTATDQNNCTASAQVTITQPNPITANISSTGSITCNGGNNGYAVVTPGGGTGSYIYSWAPTPLVGANLPNASGFTAGTYVATVRDDNGCIATATATILEPAPFATTLTTTDPKCNGECDGTGILTYAGGAGATTFLWQPGLQTGGSVSNLCVGGNTLTITSNGACSTVLTFTLTEPAPLTAVASSTNSNCGQANGRTCLVVSGGTSPYTTLWSNNATTLCNNNIVAGAYTNITTDANGCTVNSAGLVNDIAAPVVTIITSTNVSCFGGFNGGATATITGGAGNETIFWNGSQQTPNTNATATNFGSGLHTITVTDQAGCVGNDAVTITQPSQLVSAIGSFTNVSCFGLTNGGATMLVNGGTANYTYSWSPSGQSSAVLVSVGANTYTCNVTDAHGCLTSQQVTISQPQELTMASSSFSNISCFGGNNGQIATSPQGGTGSLTYSWTPNVPSPGAVINGLAAGNYALLVTDNNNCQLNANFTITEPSPLTSSYVSLPATCNSPNGSATVTVSGGTQTSTAPFYNMSWNTATLQNGPIAVNMSPGNNWACVIIDAKGCSITQTVEILSPPTPTITGFNITQASCFGAQNGEIVINYTSGTAPYTVSWSNPISQTVTTTAFSQTVVGIGAGAYTATLIDGYGCITSQQAVMLPTPKLIVLPSVDDKICYGQSKQIDASGQGGTPPYSYTWTPTPFVGSGPHTVSPTLTQTYVVAISDSKGCVTTPTTITIFVMPRLTVTEYPTTICHGDTVILEAEIDERGNGGAYTYTWTPGFTNTNTLSVVGNAPTTATSYTYGVTASDHCTFPNATAVFTVNVNPLPTAIITAPAKGCSPLTATLTALSSNPSTDSYQWFGDGTSLGTSNPLVQTFTQADSITVDLEVTTALGCKNSFNRPDYIVVYPQPIASFYANPSPASILEPNVNFTNTSQQATNYSWNFGDPAAAANNNVSVLQNPSHYYNFVGTYAVHLTATSPQGCSDIAKVLVEITPDYALYIPNSFTPDANGVNDIFQPAGVGINEDDYRMDIYDRWGESIFTSNNFRKGWDGSVKGGKIAEQGVYVYKLMVRDTQGNKHPYVGHVTVLRKDN